MSNLNDFIGGTSLKFWRSDGVISRSSNGAYDSDSRVQILGTTTDTHYWGKEFKLHHAPDKRIFSVQSSSSNNVYLKIDKSASTVNAPNPSESAVHTDNLSPTMQDFARCLRYKVYTKRNSGDSYTLKGEIDFSSITLPALGTSTTIEGVDPNVNANMFLEANYSNSTQSKYWQGSTVQQADFAQLRIVYQLRSNLDEAFITTEDEGQIFVKVQWELDNTTYNNLFVRTYNEVQGISFENASAMTHTALYSGERQYASSLYAGYNN